MKIIIIGFVMVALLSGLAQAATWNSTQVDQIFATISAEIQALEKNQKPSLGGATQIITALEQVFKPQAPFVKVAHFPPFKGTKDEYLARIAAWQTVANYALWGIWMFGKEPLLKDRAVELYHQYFAEHQAFYSLIRDYQFFRLKTYLDLENEDFVDGIVAPESLAVLAQAEVQKVNLAILNRYLYAEGVVTFEYLPLVFNLPNLGPSYQSLKILREAVVAPQAYGLNLWQGSTCHPLSLARANDPSVLTWLSFMNKVLRQLQVYQFTSGLPLSAEFSYVNFGLSFDFPVWLKNGNEKILGFNGDLKDSPWILDGLVETEIAQVIYDDHGSVQRPKVLQIYLNLLPAAWAQSKALQKKVQTQLQHELNDVNIPRSSAKKLRIFARLAKYGQSLHNGDPLMDAVINLLPANRTICARNFLRP